MEKMTVGIAAIAMGMVACGGNCADTVVYGTIRTAETEMPVAEALAIKDGKFVYVGDKAGAVGAPAGAKNVVERYPEGIGAKQPVFQEKSKLRRIQR